MKLFNILLKNMMTGVRLTIFTCLMHFSLPYYYVLAYLLGVFTYRLDYYKLNLTNTVRIVITLLIIILIILAVYANINNVFGIIFFYLLGFFISKIE